MVIWIKFAHFRPFSSLITKISMFTLAMSCFYHFPFTLLHGPNISVSYAILSFIAPDFTSITCYIHIWALFLHWLCLFILSGIISPLFSSSILGTYKPGSSSFSVPSFAFLYCLWNSQGKNTEVVCHSLIQWTTFFQNSLPWHVHLG